MNQKNKSIIDVFDTIQEHLKSHPRLNHAAAILKLKKTKDCPQEIQSIANKYNEYLEANLNTIGFDESIIQKRVKLLNDYYNSLHNSVSSILSTKKTFGLSIIEEFLFLLLKDYWGEGGLPSNIHVVVNTSINKTKLENMALAAETEKRYNYQSVFISVTETYDVPFDVDPAYSRIDQIYVLRKTTRKAPWADIAEDVVLDLFNEIKMYLERPKLDIRSRMIKKGEII